MRRTIAACALLGFSISFIAAHPTQIVSAPQVFQRQIDIPRVVMTVTVRGAFPTESYKIVTGDGICQDARVAAREFNAAQQTKGTVNHILVNCEWVWPTKEA